jgi:hypothetical protein
MKDLFLEGLTIAYVIAGIICCVAYYPTIRDLYFHKRASANIMTYLLWTITALITLVYSLYVSSDILFRFISAINLAACSLVLYLSVAGKNVRRE